VSGKGFRLPIGGLIDRDMPVRFRFDGRSYSGFAGDSLASALLANGVRTLARSFKYHRPRGLLGAGAEESNALVALHKGPRLDTNVRATEVVLSEGLEAASINCWPSVRFDVGSIADSLHRLIPAGFYYKTFMRPGWEWFEGMIRRTAGLGHAPTLPDPERYEHAHASCDVLVVGGGPAGLAAACTAARTGARVILADEQTHFGGSLLWTGETIDGRAGHGWAEDIIRELRRTPEVTVLPRTSITSYYDHNFLTALQTLDTDTAAARQRMWQIRASQVILATGAVERPLVFPDNDRPGIMLASAVRQYRNRYAVLTGDDVVVFTNNDSAYQAALDLKASGARVTLVDVREEPPASLVATLRQLDILLLAGHGIASTFGRSSLRGIEVAPLNGNGERQRLACNVVAMSGGWNPTLHLFCQSGGKARFDERLVAFVPGHSGQSVRTAGAANGSFGLSDCLQEGSAAGTAAASSAGFSAHPAPAWSACGESACMPQAIWRMPASIAGNARQWIDFQSDVTSSDVELAARENFVSVEHLKRYTTLGMATDQGKTSNINGLGVLAEITGRAIPEVGTTTFRPPYTPVTFGAMAGRDVGALFHPQRRLPTHARQIDLRAHMDDYGGWLRPAYYPQEGEKEVDALRREVLAVRNHVGIMDYSPLGKIEVSGPDALSFLNRMVVTDLSTLALGRTRYNLFLNERGVIIDDGVVSRLDDQRWLVGTTSGGAPRIAQWLESWHQREWPQLKAFISNATSAWGVILLSGPKARELLSRVVTDIDLSKDAFPHMSVRCGHIDAVPTRIHRVSFTGEVSYEVAVPSGYVASLWDWLIDIGRDLGITPFGIESVNVMRIEKGYLHLGADTDGNTVPDDVGYGRIVQKKPYDFIGKRSLSLPHMKRPDRLQLVGLQSLNATQVLVNGAQLLQAGVTSLPAQTQGFVTSSCWSPTLQRPHALALLLRGRQRMGERICIYSAGQWSQAVVTTLTAFDTEGAHFNG
jgi:sarcosine oxidase, subunit alpha